MASSSNGHTGDLGEEFRFSSDVTLDDIRASQQQFCIERNFQHTPKNVLLSLVAEVGELTKNFLWKGEVSKGIPELSSEEQQNVGEEISDILINLVDLAALCHVDLPAAVHDKMQRNAEKYPPISLTPNCAKYSVYGEPRSLVGSSAPEMDREEGDGSE